MTVKPVAEATVFAAGSIGLASFEWLANFSNLRLGIALAGLMTFEIVFHWRRATTRYNLEKETWRKIMLLSQVVIASIFDRIIADVGIAGFENDMAVMTKAALLWLIVGQAAQIAIHIDRYVGRGSVAPAILSFIAMAKLVDQERWQEKHGTAQLPPPRWMYGLSEKQVEDLVRKAREEGKI